MISEAVRQHMEANNVFSKRALSTAFPTSGKLTEAQIIAFKNGSTERGQADGDAYQEKNDYHWRSIAHKDGQSSANSRSRFGHTVA